MNKYYIFTAIGAIIITVIVMHIIKKKAAASDTTVTAAFKELAKTQEFQNVLLSKEGKVMMSTPQFKKMATNAALQSIANFI